MWGNANDESMISGPAGVFGFLDSSSKFDSPGTAKKDGGAKRSQSVTPVVICMLQNCTGEEFTMWGRPTSILVCIVRKFEVTSTTVNYELEDHTGKINAIFWLEHDNSQKADIPVDKENIYVKVFGTFRIKTEEKIVMILKIAPLDKMNEITCHLLEVIHVRLFSEKKSKGEAVAIKANNPGAELTNSMMSYVGGEMAMEEEGMTPIQRNVFRFMKENNTEVGVSRTKIHENFLPNQKKDVDSAINFLVSEGHIFSTIDHDHFQLTTT